MCNHFNPFRMKVVVVLISQHASEAWTEKGHQSSVFSSFKVYGLIKPSKLSKQNIFYTLYDSLISYQYFDTGICNIDQWFWKLGPIIHGKPEIVKKFLGSQKKNYTAVVLKISKNPRVQIFYTQFRIFARKDFLIPQTHWQ